MSKEITVLTVPVGQEPHESLMPAANGLKWLKEFVGARIDHRYIGPGLVLTANENGVNLRLPYNRCGFVGNFLIRKLSPAGNTISMTKKDIEAARAWLDRNDHRPPLCHVCGLPGGATMFCECGDVLIFCPACYETLGNEMSPARERRFGLCARCREKERT